MTQIKKTLTGVMEDGSKIRAVLQLRDGSDGLSPGFSVTGEIWLSGDLDHKPDMRREPDVAGAIGVSVAATWPHLKDLVDLHLASPDGIPMHALANGWYFYSGDAARYERWFIEQVYHYSYYSKLLEKSDHDRAAEALGVSPVSLPTGMSKEEFTTFYEGLKPAYARRAKRGIALLNSLPDDTKGESR